MRYAHTGRARSLKIVRRSFGRALSTVGLRLIRISTIIHKVQLMNVALALGYPSEPLGNEPPEGLPRFAELLRFLEAVTGSTLLDLIFGKASSPPDLITMDPVMRLTGEAPVSYRWTEGNGLAVEFHLPVSWI